MALLNHISENDVFLNCGPYEEEDAPRDDADLVADTGGSGRANVWGTR